MRAARIKLRRSSPFPHMRVRTSKVADRLACHWL